MATVRLHDVTKRFGETTVIPDLNLAIADGEFVVLVGPSGCGKTTTLRMVAGLEDASAGRIVIGDRDVTRLRPGLRNCAMVFQNYALYPHMTVRENITYGLRVRRTPRAEIDRLLTEAVRILGLEPFLDRRPRQLSGGQQQRVAIGRAIVRQPDVFLFDEPLSNLDAKLRVETRAELARLHRRLAATIVYVTHDQEEAMTLGSRVAVMRDGFLQQVAPPMELYRRPANRFVAGFVGSPAMNFLPAGIVPALQQGNRAATLGIRPHDLVLVTAGGGDVDARVDVVEPRGSELLVYLRLDARGNGPELRVVAPPETSVDAERVVGVKFDREKLHWFDAENGQRI
jgi:multiple sugar transport system ATP-binding protein